MKYDGDNYFVADQVFVKYKTNALGQKSIDDIIVIENKLKSSTQLTTPQTRALSKNIYTVRNAVDKVSEFGSSNTLKQNNALNYPSAGASLYSSCPIFEESVNPLVTEVSFDVVIDGKTFRTRLDGIGFDEVSGMYKVIEAKMGGAVFSESQSMFMKALKEGTGEIIAVGENARRDLVMI